MMHISNNTILASNFHDTQNHTLSDADKIKIMAKEISKCHTEEDRNSLRELKREIIKEQCENNISGRTTTYNGYDLQGVDLSNLNLSYVDFTNGDLRSTNMTNTNLSHSILYGAMLTGIQWNNTNITNARVDLDNICLLPLSTEEQYEKIIECVGEIKSNDTLHQENDAIDAFRASLDTENKMQARLSKLDNQQLQILLPYLYVEATHWQNPIIAYNMKDIGFNYSKEDDNALMIKGYASLLSTLNGALGSNHNFSYENKVAKVASGIKKLAALLTEPLFIADRGNTIFHIEKNYIFDFDKLQHKIENNKLTLDALKYDIEIFTKKNGIKALRGVIDNSIANKTKILDQFSRKLVNTHAQSDITGIFKLTSDFQYLHLLPNANGRTSQIIRDCFALHLGELPFSTLACMSHYIYLSGPVNQKHLDFMQKNSNAVLTAIEEKRLTTNIYKEIIDEQIPFIEKDSATHFDATMFYSAYYRNENAKNNISEHRELEHHDLD